VVSRPTATNNQGLSDNLLDAQARSDGRRPRCYDDEFVVQFVDTLVTAGYVDIGGATRPILLICSSSGDGDGHRFAPARQGHMTRSSATRIVGAQAPRVTCVTHCGFGICRAHARCDGGPTMNKTKGDVRLGGLT